MDCRPRSPLVLVLTLGCATALLLAGCGESTDRDPPGPGPTGSPPAGPPPEPHVDLPDGFPAEFPDPPAGTVLHRAVLEEYALLRTTDTGELEDVGTAVNRSYQFDTGAGAEEEAEEVADHFRTALEDAGWDILRDVLRTPGDGAAGGEVTVPTFQIIAEGHGYRGRIGVAQREDVIRTDVTVTEPLPDRAPYAGHPPLIPLPAWFADLAASLPEDAVRERVAVTDRLGEPVLVSVDFTVPDQAGPDNGHRVLESVADHYRQGLPAAGWTITLDEDDRDTEELSGGDVRESEHRRLAATRSFDDLEITGQVSASQVTYRSRGTQAVGGSVGAEGPVSTRPAGGTG